MFCLTMLFCVGNMIFNSFDTSFFKVTQLLKDIDLTEQKDTLSMNLSGGQKRKLCVGVALVGNPKVLMICLRHYKSKSVECLHGHIIRCKQNYFYRFGAEYVLFFLNSKHL